MKKIVKISFISIILFGVFAVLTVGFYIAINIFKYSNLPLDMNLVDKTSISIPVLDKDGNVINDENTFNAQYIKLKEIPPYTYQSFISIEDKNFYKHRGINPKRIVAATIKNLKSMAFKEGASTISQQLIKNTHLSSKKTIDRKIKEFILTYKLEKKLSKEEILEKYLNVIYFGNNCYGIGSASNYYFSKSCNELTLAESATLAGLIKAPNKYSPITNKDLCLKRRNLVLKEMLKDKKITEEEFEKAKSTPLSLNIKKDTNKLNTYSNNAIEEAQKILHLPAKQIALAGYKIHTYMDKSEQNRLVDALKTTFNQNDYAAIVIDSKSMGITAFYGKSNYKILQAKRQPGSCIKPILVYAPALNEDIISPETQILDEKIKISEYSPENINGKYSGYISVKESVSKSINVPAVKVLSYVGIEKAKNYAKNMGIDFDENDNSYALALGGMTYGVSLKELADAYSTFANAGNYSKSKFISLITNDKGEVIYKHKPTKKQVLREDTAYLMTDILQYTAKNGTAKRLSELEIDIASKTGTVGAKHSKQNLDAYNISFTPSKICGVWTGNLDNTPIRIAGGNEPTEVVKKFFKGSKNESFLKPNEIVERDIDLIEYEENHVVKLANPETPKRFKKTCMFSIFNLPSQGENFANLAKIDAKIKQIGEKSILSINAKKYLIYEIYNDKGKLIENISESEGVKDIEINSNKITIKAKYIGSKNYNEKEFNINSI